MGGTLTVRSTVGADSTFTLALPDDAQAVRPPESLAAVRDERQPA